MFKCEFPGNPRVLKNSKQIMVNRRTGCRFVTKSDLAMKAMERATSWFRVSAIRQKLDKAIAVPVHMKATFYWAGPPNLVPDLSNLYQLPEDALQRAGVLVDDRLIESHDGSRRVAVCATCSERQKGRQSCKLARLDQCPKARTVIVVTPF